MSELLERIDRLNEIGIALSAESNTGRLLELKSIGSGHQDKNDGYGEPGKPVATPKTVFHVFIGTGQT